MVRDGVDVPVPGDSEDLGWRPLFPQLSGASSAALAASLERARGGSSSTRSPPGFFGCAGPVYTEPGGSVATAGAIGSSGPPATDLSQRMPQTLLYDEGNQYWDYNLDGGSGILGGVGMLGLTLMLLAVILVKHSNHNKHQINNRIAQHGPTMCHHLLARTNNNNSQP